jgi:DNA ligase D-like protein (predicted 3'-phosphoesterase)
MSGVIMDEARIESLPPDKDPLKKYLEKRNFEITSEPKPLGEGGSPGQIFVIQKHSSRRLHHDLRLEVDGVLKSFAVPKGPSMNPRDKRLAIQTEDHPLEYASFQGRIPEGEYGAGTMEIWDRGSYRNMSRKEGKDISLAQALQEGHAAFWLEGEKLSGGFALTRTRQGWLLVKMRDEKADSESDAFKDRT